MEPKVWLKIIVQLLMAIHLSVLRLCFNLVKVNFNLLLSTIRALVYKDVQVLRSGEMDNLVSWNDSAGEV